MTITLESIQTEHARISAMIEDFKKQPKTTEYLVAAVKIPLAPGETYAGMILGKNESPDYHLILLPDEIKDVQWSRAAEWATGKGGDLPTRREQSLLFSNSKDEFDGVWYWSGEQHEKNAGWAWYQGFYDGIQSYGGRAAEFRARAVRRFIPSVI